MTTDTINKSSAMASSLEDKLWLLLKFFICWEFVGHGAFGVITKAGWLPFFRVFGIPDDIAWKLMPMVGAFDIAMGVLILFTPRKGVLMWMAFWGVFTALLRPLSGTSFSEFFERAYNFGTPFLLLYFSGFPKNIKEAFSKYEMPRPTDDQLKFAVTFLKLCIASYLFGHACFGLFDKQGTMIMLHENAGFASIFGSVEQSAFYFGFVEVILGIAVLALPNTPVLITICAWKVFTEGLYLPVDKPWIFFEFIERGGAYAMPIALILIQKLQKERE